MACPPLFCVNCQPFSYDKEMFNLKVIIMTRKLQFFLTALLLTVGVTSAWADNDLSKTICVEGNETNFTDLATAINAVTDATLTNIYINDDITVSSSIEFKSGTNASKQVKIMAGKDNVVIKSGSTNRLFLVNSSTAQLLLGGGSCHLIIDGDNKSYGSGFISIEADKNKVNSDKVYFLDNITIKNVNATGSDGSGYVYQRKNSGHDMNVFRNVTFDNCDVKTTGSVGIVRYLRQNTLYLEGTINFTNTCSGASFYLDATKCILRNNSSTLTDLTISNPITVRLNENQATDGNKFKTAQTILVLFNDANAGKVSLVNKDLELYKSGTSDWKLRQSYKLSVSAAGAATLVLPFESTIPSGATCYTLSYTSGDDITATKVTGSTLSANTPVLVTATTGEYSFTTTAEGNTAIAAGTGTPTSDVLTGVYTETKPTNDQYILSYKDNVLAFRKADGSTNKVQPYHAYMSVTHSGPNPAPAFYNINFGGITGISNPKVEQNMMDDENAPIYNLQGVRMNSQNLPKGIYVKNGRKFVVK